MRLPPSEVAAFALAALLATALALAQDDSASLPVTQGAIPTRAQTDAAAEAVKADPDIAPKRTIRTLQWDGPKPKDAQRSGPPEWLRWIVELFRWVAQSARLVVWVAAAVLVALVAYYVVRLLRGRGRARSRAGVVAPTHVRDLDIRPESLPDDVGAAARSLWVAGEHRAALALLYRGLLSRLVHAHGVPIRDSSTEGDTLALAQARLTETRNAYAARLVRTWQRAVYGDERPADAIVLALCGEFAAALDPPPPEPAVASS